jgi:hypothetical protein
MIMSEMKPDEHLNIELTKFVKSGQNAILTKVASVDASGKIKIDGSKCRMSNGNAYRLLVPSVHALASAINSLGSNEAIAIGSLKEGVSDGAHVVTKRELPKPEQADVIARTKDFVIFPEYKAGYILFDIDTKGMPQPVRDRVAALGGAWPSIVGAAPKLGGAARVIRKSSSSGISNLETGETRDSDGEHIFVLINDATAIPETLKRIHDMLWLAGLGWYVVGAAGQMLERSLVDTAVGSPERLVFEGPVILAEPLVQAPRPALAFDGVVIDINNAVLPWGGKSNEAVKATKQKARHSLREECEVARAKWSASRIQNLVETGYSESDARAEIGRWLDDYKLTGECELHFADPRIGAVTVAEILAEPDDYVGENLYDLFEDPIDPDTRCDRTRLWLGKDGKLRVGTFDGGGQNWLLATKGMTSVTDFYAHLKSNLALEIATGQAYPMSNIDKKLPYVKVGVDQKGKDILQAPSTWLLRNQCAEAVSWVPGEAAIIEDRIFGAKGWIDAPGAKTFNTFRLTAPPVGGDATRGKRWHDHGVRVYGGDWDHIEKTLVFVVRNPGVKVNHMLVFGGAKGIGKDSLLVPIEKIIGGDDVGIITPREMLRSGFNEQEQCRLLKINELHDVGDSNRFELANLLLTKIAGPPDYVTINHKYGLKITIPNTYLTVGTTNHERKALHLTEDERRYYFAWSSLRKEDLGDHVAFFQSFHDWLDNGGVADVYEYLLTVDLSEYNPKAPPRLTQAALTVIADGVDVDRDELRKLLDEMNMNGVTIPMLIDEAQRQLTAAGVDKEYGRYPANCYINRLLDRGYSRNSLPLHLAEEGYTPVIKTTSGGRAEANWGRGKNRSRVYARGDLPEDIRIETAEILVSMRRAPTDSAWPERRVRFGTEAGRPSEISHQGDVEF